MEITESLMLNTTWVLFGTFFICIVAFPRAAEGLGRTLISHAEALRKAKQAYGETYTAAYRGLAGNE